MESNDKCDLIYRAMDDASNTIKFIDTKAASAFVVLGILITLFISLCEKILFVYKNLNTPVHSSIIGLSILIYLASTIISIYYGFKTINATNNPNKYIDNDFYKGKNLWYLGNDCDNKIEISVKDYLNEINNINEENILGMISVEFMKVSAIRNIKIKSINQTFFWMKISMISVFIPIIYIIIYYSFI